MKIIPKHHKDVYNKQEERGSFDVPPTGTYIVVNTKLQHQTIGENNTPRVQVWSRILAVVETEDPAQMDEAKEWRGKDLQQSLWWNLEKRGNQERVACMGIACGQMDEWDPEVDSQLVKAITGIPYQLKGNKREEEYKGQARVNFNVLATQQLSADKRKEFTSAPDWSKTVGDIASRMVPKESSGKKGGGGGGGSRSSTSSSKDTSKVQDVDPFGDMPFSDGTN